jgi:photosystem II stability/assembly factor-like uncharacterized protein
MPSEADVKGLWWLLLAALCLASACCARRKSAGNAPFALTWSEGMCVGCKTAFELGRIQFITRNEAWAVGCNYPPPEAQGSGDFIVVHTKDAGHTWTEVPQTSQHAGDADGPPAFSFLDAARGWIAWWEPSDEPKVIRTTDSGNHWQELSHQFLQKIRLLDERRGYGAETSKFLRTNDGGRTWAETQMAHIRFIDRMFFLTSELGWISGAGERAFYVYRTTNEGRDWEESRTAANKEVANVRDLFFLDQERGWVITWHSNGTYLFSTIDGGKTWTPEHDSSFQGTGQWAATVRFVSPKTGFVFVNREDKAHYIMYTTDGGKHWNRAAIPHSVYDCQVFDGDLLCSAGTWPSSGFRLLTVHPK